VVLELGAEEKLRLAFGFSFGEKRVQEILQNIVM